MLCLFFEKPNILCFFFSDTKIKFQLLKYFGVLLVLYYNIGFGSGLLDSSLDCLLALALGCGCDQMGSEEYEPLLLGLDSNARIPDLSSVAIEEFLQHRPSVALRWWPRLVAWESRLLWLLSRSSIVVSVFNYMLSFVTLMFTGHLGALELAGASIASVGIQGLAYGIMVFFFSYSFMFFWLISYINSMGFLENYS